MGANEEEWVVVDETAGPGLAEILRGLLEACGIEARVSQEGAWQAFPLTVGKLGTAQLLVRASQADLALSYLEEYYNQDIQPSEGSESPSQAEDQE
jgi:hypothetical protein